MIGGNESKSAVGTKKGTARPRSQQRPQNNRTFKAYSQREGMPSGLTTGVARDAGGPVVSAVSARFTVTFAAVFIPVGTALRANTITIRRSTAFVDARDRRTPWSSIIWSALFIHHSVVGERERTLDTIGGNRVRKVTVTSRTNGVGVRRLKPACVSEDESSISSGVQSTGLQRLIHRTWSHPRTR